MKTTSPRTDNLSLDATINGDAFGIERLDGYSIAAKWTDTTMAATTFAPAAVNTGASTITLTGHSLITAEVVQFSTTGTLPAPLAAATNYYVIVVDANTIKVATSAANANLGTAITITTQGTGTHTITPTALAGTFKLQVSNDPFTNNVNSTPNSTAQWDDVSGSSVSAAGNGQQTWNVSAAYYAAARVVFTSTTGRGTVAIKYLGKGII